MGRFAAATVLLFGLIVLGLGGRPLQLSRASVDTCDGNWHVVSGPTGLGQLSQLHGVAGTSPTDVWAVGSTGDPLIEHWDGSNWSVVASPAIAGGYLSDVAALSPDDAWAVGSMGSLGTAPLIEHWNGTSWSVVPSPTPTSSISRLNSVAAVSSDDVWAVGNDGHATLIEHWNGINWSVVPSPVPTNSINYFASVSAVSSDDVWAVGSSSSGPGVSQTLLGHWDGQIWSVGFGPSTGGLSSVSASSSTDAWAVGGVDSETLVERWDGNQWNIVSSPNPGLSGSDLASVVVVSPTNVWAVGAAANSVGPSVDIDPLIEHWDGSGWSVAPVPNVGGPEAVLHAIAAPTANDLWAVGYVTSIVGELVSLNTLVMHWCQGSLLQTMLSADAAAGSTELAVEDSDGFALGDHILVNPDGPNQEDSHIAGFGSILLTTPLGHSHSVGETVIKLVAGDGDCSGRIALADVTLLLKQISGLASEATCAAAWDVDCNSAVTSIDALVILRSIASVPASPTASNCPDVGT